MKKCFLVCATVLGATAANGQIDSSDKYIFSCQIATGVVQTNFSALHKCGYLLNRPANINFNYPSLVFFIGNPKKFFVTVPWGFVFSRQVKGIYNGYNISANGGQSYLGIDISFPLKTRFDRKGLQGIYCSIGAQHTRTTVTSKAQGINSAMHDTTFYYEASHATNYLVNAEIMLEFGKIGQYPGARLPFVFVLGYNLQFQKPKWSGTYYRNVGDENPNVNQGGFYFRIGFNMWTTNRFWNGIFHTQQKQSN